MALHLVTGYAGKTHITSADQGALHAAIFGRENYVLNTGNCFSAQAVTSNSVKVLDGEVIMQGRHIRLEPGAYEEVTIENGTQEYFRNDLICIRYTKDADTGIESASFVVIKGTPDAYSAIDPEYNEGNILNGILTVDLPLYRVPLSGLNIGDLVPLFETKGSIDERIKAVSEDAEKEIAKLKNGTTAVGKAKDSLLLNGLTAEEFVSNDNLLINADFRNPVNSSGKTSWTGAGNTIDAWMIQDSVAITELTENGIKVTANHTNPLHWIHARNAFYLNSGNYMFSAKIRANRAFNVRFGGTSKLIKVSTEWTVITCAYIRTTSGNFTFQLTTDASTQVGDWVEIEYIKLELGSVATPPTPPNKEVEKLKCGATVGDAESVNGFKIYTDISQFGGTSYFIPELVKMMPVPSMFITEVHADYTFSLSDANNQLPSPNGTLEIIRPTNALGRTRILYTVGTNTSKTKTYLCDIDETNKVINGWRDISDGGNADTVDGYHASDFPIIKSARNVTVVDGNHQYIRLNVDNTVPDLPTSNYTHFITTYESGGVVSAVSIGRDYVSDIFSYSEKDKTWHKLGRASDFLPLDGSVPMSGRLLINNGYGRLNSGGYGQWLTIICNETNDDSDTSNCRYIQLNTKKHSSMSHISKALQLRDRTDGVETNYDILHTGNSQKVTITDSADDVPSEMSGLWAY